MPTSTQATSYGYTSTFIGMSTVDEANAWFEDVKAVVEGQTSFGQVIDLRRLSAQSPEVTAIVGEAMGYLLAQGMQRSAVLVSSVVTRMQIMRLAKTAGMYAYERYFAVGVDEELPAAVMAWVLRGVDPDANEHE